MGINFISHTITRSADLIWSVYAIDVDGDGDIDVLSASSYDDKVEWYESDLIELEPTSVPTVVPTSVPTYECYPGTFHSRGFGINADQCIPCPEGTYSGKDELTDCFDCSGITWSTEGSSSQDECKYTSLGVDTGSQVAVIVTIVVLQICVFCLDRPRNNRLHYGLVVLFSSFDTNSDLLFILSSVFYSRVLYGLFWTFFFLPLLQFCYRRRILL